MKHKSFYKIATLAISAAVIFSSCAISYSMSALSYAVENTTTPDNTESKVENSVEANKEADPNESSDTESASDSTDANNSTPVMDPVAAENLQNIQDALAQYYRALQAMQNAGLEIDLSNPGIEAHAQNYYKKSVFIGDSVMVGFANFSKRNANAVAHQATFLSATSFAIFHALKDVSKDKLQPTYNGRKDNVWNLIADMDVERVFIYLGTNDLVGIDPAKTSDRMMELCEKIKASKPGVEIHIVSMSPCYYTSTKGYLNNPAIDEYNLLLSQKAAANGYFFVDINSSLKDATGNLEASYSSDKFVHLKTSAYQVWNNIFAGYVK
ncbi:MAG: GDSL-type esterase/lipase family protein [Lachnospiraceae bacterium]|nr:GDSL-type esterase/lipase family protein [Lachnospiraceae bacterium]